MISGTAQFDLVSCMLLQIARKTRFHTKALAERSERSGSLLLPLNIKCAG